MGAYREGSTVQNARTALQEFNVIMQDIGTIALPGVNKMLAQFRDLLEKIRGALPGNAAAKNGAMANVEARAGWGAIGGTLVGGAFGGPGGAILGGFGGGMLGTAEGWLEEHNKPWNLGIDAGGSHTSPGKTGRPSVEKTTVEVKPQSVTLNVNLDGQQLAQTMTTMMMSAMGLPTQAPTFDGSGSFVGGDHQHSDN